MRTNYSFTLIYIYIYYSRLCENTCKQEDRDVIDNQVVNAKRIQKIILVYTCFMKIEKISMYFNQFVRERRYVAEKLYGNSKYISINFISTENVTCFYGQL